MTDNEIKTQIGLLHSAIAELSELASDLIDRLARLEAQAKEKEIKA